jgi:transposase
MALSEQGMTHTQIAEKLGMSKSYVYKALDRSHGPRLTTPVKSGRQVIVDEDTIDAIEPIAAERGIPVHAFIRKILDRVAADNLFSAILDK